MTDPTRSSRRIDYRVQKLVATSSLPRASSIIMKRYEKRDRAASVEESSPCLEIVKVSNLAAREIDSWFITRLLRVPGTWYALICGRYTRKNEEMRETGEERRRPKREAGEERMRGDLASLSYVRTYTQATIARLHLPAADLASFFPWCLRCFFAVAARSFSNIIHTPLLRTQSVSFRRQRVRYALLSARAAAIFAFRCSTVELRAPRSPLVVVRPALGLWLAAMPSHWRHVTHVARRVFRAVMSPLVPGPV